VGKKNQNGNSYNAFTAIIETPSGSRNKYVWDQKRTAFRLTKVLPAGMVFPYNFGFVPGTEAADGDPLDVLVLMDAPAFPGCILDCILLGAIEAEQINKKGKVVRNDRLIAADINDSTFSNIASIEQLPTVLLDEIKAFFVNYNQVEGKKFKILRICESRKAAKLIKKARVPA
jgi:inorganic pyrophosphatase